MVFKKYAFTIADKFVYLQVKVHLFSIGYEFLTIFNFSVNLTDY